MDRLATALLLVVALTGCPGRPLQGDTDVTSQATTTTSQGDTHATSQGDTHATSPGTTTTSQGDTDATSQATGTTSLDPDALDEGCSGAGGTHAVISYSEAWIVDPIDQDTPLWKAPREACELSTILDLDFTADGALYVIHASFIHKVACGDTCPWRYWLRRLSPEGEEEWAKSFDFPAVDLRALRVLADGGVVIGGGALAGQDRSPWLARFDAAGSLLWEEIFAEHGQINAIGRGPDDVVVAVGSVEAGAATDLWAVQMTSDGALGWTSSLGDDRHESAVAVAVDSAGRSWIVGGRAVLPIDDPPTDHPLPYEGYLDPSSFEFLRSFDVSLVALMDEQGALLWFDEPAPMDTAASRGALGVDLLPGGDAVVGASWDWSVHWIARYTADGSRVWETVVKSTDQSLGSYFDELACDALGRTHVLADGMIVQLDDAGGVIDDLEPHVYGDQLALTPADAVRVTDYRWKGEYYE